MFSTEVLAIDAPHVARDIEQVVRRLVQAFRTTRHLHATPVLAFPIARIEA